MSGHLTSIEQLRARVAELEAANEALQFRLSELVGSPDDGSVDVPGLGRIHMTPQRGLILRLLLGRKGQMVSLDALYQAMCGHRPDADWPELRMITVHVCHVRKAIRGSAVAIENVWGRGYRLVDVARAEVGA